MSVKATTTIAANGEVTLEILVEADDPVAASVDLIAFLAGVKPIVESLIGSRLRLEEDSPKGAWHCAGCRKPNDPTDVACDECGKLKS
ncbi:hypothetical protein D3C72_1270630 [compost metagenome]